MSPSAIKTRASFYWPHSSLHGDTKTFKIFLLMGNLYVILPLLMCVIQEIKNTKMLCGGSSASQPPLCAISCRLCCHVCVLCSGRKHWSPFMHKSFNQRKESRVTEPKKQNNNKHASGFSDLLKQKNDREVCGVNTVRYLSSLCHTYTLAHSQSP